MNQFKEIQVKEKRVPKTKKTPSNNTGYLIFCLFVISINVNGLYQSEDRFDNEKKSNNIQPKINVFQI